MKKTVNGVLGLIESCAKGLFPLAGGATLYRVDITRRLATLVLNNPHPSQRPCKKGGLHVRRLVNMLDAGEWSSLASDNMHFDTQGRCVQGQHRLTAFLESRQTMLQDQLLIVHGNDDLAMATAQLLDQSIRVRNIADAGRMSGLLSNEEANRTFLSAIAFNRCGFDYHLFKGIPITRRAAIAVAMKEEEPELFERTLKLFESTPKLRSKPFLSAAIECMRFNAVGNDAYDFFHAVGNDQPVVNGSFSIQANMLISFFRDRRRGGAGEAQEREDLYRCIRYYNAYRKGEVFDKHLPYQGVKGEQKEAMSIPTPVSG